MRYHIRMIPKTLSNATQVEPLDLILDTQAMNEGNMIIRIKNNNFAF